MAKIKMKIIEEKKKKDKKATSKVIKKIKMKMIKE